MISNGRVDITPPPVDKFDRLIVKHSRLSPLIDTFCKIVPLMFGSAVVLTPILWAFFGEFLGLIGQRPLPIEQAGQWHFLLLFIAAAACAVAALVSAPAVLTLYSRHADASDSGRAQLAYCRVAVVTFLGIVLTISVGSYAPYADSWMPLAVMVILFVAGYFGGKARLEPAPFSYRAVAPLALLAGGQALVFALWLVSMWPLFSFTLSAETGFALAANVVVALSGTLFLLLTSVTRPWLGIGLCIALTGFWTVRQANPNEGFLIAKALYTANLGGGRPARITQDDVDGEICDLGVERRSVLIYEPAGCEWSVVQKRFKSLHGLDSLQRKRILSEWKKEAACARHLPKEGCDGSRHAAP